MWPLKEYKMRTNIVAIAVVVGILALGLNVPASGQSHGQGLCGSTANTAEFTKRGKLVVINAKKNKKVRHYQKPRKQCCRGK